MVLHEFPGLYRVDAHDDIGDVLANQFPVVGGQLENRDFSARQVLLLA